MFENHGSLLTIMGRDVFEIPSPPLHDPLAVAAVLIGTAHEIPFYDWDVNGCCDAAEPERFSVNVVTDGTHAEAAEFQASGGPQTGRTVVERLPTGQKGVRIPRGVDVGRFWTVLEQCLTRADKANATNIPTVAGCTICGL